MKIAIDVDGVLTDGTLTIDHKGEKLFKRFHTRDVRAIRELIYNGHEVYLVTADEWDGTRFFADKVGAELIVTKDKGQIIVDIAIGDDVWDIPMLKRAKQAYCPADAASEVLRQCYVQPLKTKGGQGVIAEMIKTIISDKHSNTTGVWVDIQKL